jgi:hypothetical protein
MENTSIFYGHLEYFTVIWYILWTFGNVVVISYIFPLFGIMCQEKSGNPGARKAWLPQLVVIYRGSVIPPWISKKFIDT